MYTIKPVYTTIFKRPQAFALVRNSQHFTMSNCLQLLIQIISKVLSKQQKYLSLKSNC